jgi:anaerobic magnesium-protoporphyrin IX monomethyl ester cyclase
MATAQPKRSTADALFVGYEDQENLGLRSIAAYLEAHGLESVIIPFTPENPARVISAAKGYSPKLVGFSVIFQYTLDGFANLAAAMRKAGISVHFTVGGHFPSMRPREVLDALPHVDSVVRFEGEITTLELLQKLEQPHAWSSIMGLAFRRDSEVILNSPRPLIADLDSIPVPIRADYRYTPQGTRIASILASRGCHHNCSFCSIRQFYGTPPGPLRRARSPESVASEMRNLCQRDGVRFFIFQDDDFATRSKRQRRWVESFLDCLKREGLPGKIAWRIACRVDDVDEELFSRCRDCGLVAVFLGVESGNSKGLQTLNKRVTVEDNLSAVGKLKRMGLPFEIGFMLFDPDSTVETVDDNIKFLREIAADGSCSLPFNKMLPYAGTPIETRLQKEGRLKGTLSSPDYDFLDPRLNFYAMFVSRVFRFRNFDILGLVERLRAARAVQLLMRAFHDASDADEYEEALLRITAKGNVAALNTLEAALEFIAQRDLSGIVNDWHMLGYLAEFEHQAEETLRRELDRVLGKHNPEMLSAYQEEYSRRTSRMRPAMQLRSSSEWPPFFEQ